MSTPQPDSMISVLGEDIERATELAEVMTAHPISAHNHGRPWTVQEVLGVALGLGLEDMEKRYLNSTESESHVVVEVQTGDELTRPMSHADASDWARRHSHEYASKLHVKPSWPERTMTPADKVRENRLRRMAERQGLQLVKSRRRDPRALGYGLYMITEAGEPVSDLDDYTLDLDAAERCLTGQRSTAS